MVANLCGGTQLLGSHSSSLNGDEPLNGNVRRWTLSKRNIELDVNAWVKRRTALLETCIREVREGGGGFAFFFFSV